MKKIICLFLSLAVLAGIFSGCNKKNEEESSVKKTFEGTVTEVSGNCVIIMPDDGFSELNSADKISISMEKIPSDINVKEYDRFEITYNGEILESYPASLGEIYEVKYIGGMVIDIPPEDVNQWEIESSENDENLLSLEEENIVETESEKISGATGEIVHDPKINNNENEESIPEVFEAVVPQLDCGYARYENGNIIIESTVLGKRYDTSVVQVPASGNYEFCIDDGLSYCKWLVYVCDEYPSVVNLPCLSYDKIEQEDPMYKDLEKGQFIMFVCIPPVEPQEEKNSSYAFQIMK